MQASGYPRAYFKPVGVALVDRLPLIGDDEHAPAGAVERGAVEQPVEPVGQTTLGEEGRGPARAEEQQDREDATRGSTP